MPDAGEDRPPGISRYLAESAREDPEKGAWLERLPAVVRRLARRWDLRLGPPLANAGYASWIAHAEAADGTKLALKLGLPHFEARDEIAGLRAWDGDPTVLLIAADEAENALLLERCVPGTALRERPDLEQDEVIADLLRRAWLLRPPPAGFRPLAELVAYTREGLLRQRQAWPDEALVLEGLALKEELVRTAPSAALLLTDLHASNALAARRRPYLAIDPKPFVGDPAYDATQHLVNHPERLRGDARGTVERFSELVEVDAARVRAWTFGRLAAEAWERWPLAQALARRIGA